MARHRKPPPVRGATRRVRRQLTACLAGASALSATLLTLTLAPAAPPAPDRAPTGHTLPDPQTTAARR
ncbi:MULTISPECIES: hypothetical protein [Streptomyces]|uniref:Uncharacterized protein n=2 Tax=Streptomyces TaxID=1883 RepID=A0A2N8PJP7_STRNR|nr:MULTISPECIES: hypothetical protein [Streptomyces]PNE41244.1 hypothetical protein AOB60_11160 [Streptomyces noursei]SHM85830.1 hypothetical protein SAMN05216268_115154 [Streptomyces yunnanensis]